MTSSLEYRPVAPFPSLQYPLEENEEINRVEEARCIDAVRAAITTAAPSKQVAAVIVEPVGENAHQST